MSLGKRIGRRLIWGFLCLMASMLVLSLQPHNLVVWALTTMCVMYFAAMGWLYWALFPLLQAGNPEELGMFRFVYRAWRDISREAPDPEDFK